MNDPTLYDQSTVLQFALIVFPIACLVIGLGLGMLVNRKAFFLGYREHLDKHFFSIEPDRNCIFCLEERGIRKPKNGDAV